MDAIICKNRWCMVVESLLICLLAGAGSLAMARGGHGGFHGGGFHDYGWSRGFHGHAWGGFYLGPQWFWGPTFVLEGVPYYYYNGEYYTPDGDELVVVAPPVDNPAAVSNEVESSGSTAPAKAEPKVAQQSAETITVNVPNVRGGFTPVQLVKKDKGYVGPQGEYYPDHPTVDELKVLYGN
jgi:hypothetical protein